MATGTASSSGTTGGPVTPHWTPIVAADAVDAGANTQVMQFIAIPEGLADGGLVHRFAWSEQSAVGNFIFTARDDGLGNFGPATLLEGGPAPVIGTLQAVDLANGASVVAWIDQDSHADQIVAGLLILPDGGGAPMPFIDGGYLSEPSLGELALVAGSLGNEPGVFALAINGGLNAYFTSDFVHVQGFQLAPPAPNANDDIAKTVWAAPCSLPELDGGEGFCLTGQTHSKFGAPYAGAVSTALSTPTFASYQDLNDCIGTEEEPMIAGGIDDGGAWVALACAQLNWGQLRTLATPWVDNFYSLSFLPQAGTLANWNGSMVLYDPGSYPGVIETVPLTADVAIPPLHNFSSGAAQVTFGPGQAFGYQDPITGGPMGSFVEQDGGPALHLFALVPVE